MRLELRTFKSTGYFGTPIILAILFLAAHSVIATTDPQDSSKFDRIIVPTGHQAWFHRSGGCESRWRT